MYRLLIFAASLLSIQSQDFKPVFAVFHALESQGAEPFWTSRAKISVDSLTSSQPSVSIDENRLTDDDKQKLEELTKNGGRYKIKVVETSSGQHVVAYSPSDEPLEQTLKISLDPLGVLEGVSFVEPSNSKVIVDVMQAAPQPETATYVQRMDHEKREKEKSQGQDNRSFIAKYWMYIVPLVLFLVISGSANPEGQ